MNELSTQDNFPKAYIAAEHEAALYQKWEDSGAFSPHTNTKAPSFSIVMPPANANGNLHMGHALVVALEDIMLCYHRMTGDRTLWIPGSDHTGKLCWGESGDELLNANALKDFFHTIPFSGSS